MRAHPTSLVLATRLGLAALGALAGASQSSCKSLACAPGTIESNNECVAADVTTSTAACGPFTVLQGNLCVPMFPPTVCDPDTTSESPDPATGVITCVGTGVSAGCTGTFVCPTPDGTHQTACGQIYDVETGAPLVKTGATGALCTIGSEASGPCALGIQTFDAVAFASNPATATPLANGGFDIDDCGRFRVKNITQPSGPFIALGLDDAVPANAGPAGVTNTVGIAFPKAMGTATSRLEHFVAKASLTAGWTSSGGPTIASGIYMPLFRAHPATVASADSQAGVTMTKTGSTIPNDDFYFGSGATTRTTIEPAATATGPTGAALVTNGTLSGLYSGTGGLGSNCAWETHPGASVPQVLFIQIFHPVDEGGTCAQ